MKTRQAFAKALRTARKGKGLTQEDFAVVSSRTYLSTLERGQKSPTLDKVEALANTLNIHALSLLTLTYLYSDEELDIDALLAKIRLEIDDINRKRPKK